jgi:hypothetical protein
MHESTVAAGAENAPDGSAIVVRFAGRPFQSQDGGGCRIKSEEPERGMKCECQQAPGLEPEKLSAR